MENNGAAENSNDEAKLYFQKLHQRLNKAGISGWKIVFFYIGIFFGWLSPLYWLIIIAAYNMHDFGEPFLNLGYYRRTFYYGVVMLILAVIGFIIAFLVGS